MMVTVHVLYNSAAFEYQRRELLRVQVMLVATHSLVQSKSRFTTQPLNLLPSVRPSLTHIPAVDIEYHKQLVENDYRGE